MTETTPAPAGWKSIILALKKMGKLGKTPVSVKRCNGELDVKIRGAASERLQGAIDMARRLATETCESCGGGGTAWQQPGGGRETACRHCRGPKSVALKRTWHGRWDQLMTEHEAAEEDWSPTPKSRGRAWCCRWPVEQVESLLNGTHVEDDERSWRCGPWSGGWNHLLRALIGWAIAETAAGRPTAFIDIRKKWAHLNAIPHPLTERSQGGYRLIARVSQTTCQECGHPGRLRNRMNAGGGMAVACRKCEAAWGAATRKPEGSLRKLLGARFKHQGWPRDIDAEIEKGLARINAIDYDAWRTSGTVH